MVRRTDITECTVSCRQTQTAGRPNVFTNGQSSCVQTDQPVFKRPPYIPNNPETAPIYAAKRQRIFSVFALNERPIKRYNP